MGIVMIHMLQLVAKTITIRTHVQKKGVCVNLLRCIWEMTTSKSGIIEHRIIRLSQVRFQGSIWKPLNSAKIATPEKKCAVTSIANLPSIFDMEQESII
jgi:hypothetical protein